jgi:hypothetical protein
VQDVGACDDEGVGHRCRFDMLNCEQCRQAEVVFVVRGRSGGFYARRGVVGLHT